MLELQTKNIILVNNDFYDCVNGFTTIEERMFLFISNMYRKCQNQVDITGFHNLVKEIDDNGNIRKFIIETSDFIKECSTMKISVNNVMTIVKKLPKTIIKHDNGRIGSLPIFESIWYEPNEEEGKSYFEITINDTFLDVIMFNNFESGKFFKIYYNEFKKILGTNTKKLYRLVSRYVNMKYYKMPIETFKNYFMVPSSYKMTHYTRLLERSIKELETKTKFKVKFSKVKTGKTVTHINFYFSRI